MSAVAPRILIAGIGGASLGTEILKCLLASRRYRVFGCDVSPLAYGHYDPGFDATFVVDRSAYVDEILNLARRLDVVAVVPGAEEPNTLLVQSASRFEAAGIKLAMNSARVAAICSDKAVTFATLERHDFAVPRTYSPTDGSTIRALPFPCIVKPATGSGGSSHVFFARSGSEAEAYAVFLTRQGREAIVQEYVSDAEGEFTIGVLSLPGGEIVGSIALKRLLAPKLSHSQRGVDYVVSSGYSQGLIDDFRAVRETAESIAVALGSEGPLNVQGRVRNGTLIPFEINARFSASTYLRTLAGFNEVALFLDFLLCGTRCAPEPLRPGYYLRSLCEMFVPQGTLKR